MLLLILIILVTENVYLVQNEKLEAQFLDSTNFKNALAKELLKKKLLNLESARQQDSLAQFLKKGEKNPIRGRPNFNVDDDPSRKQAQMANSFIASSNLLFGTKSQRRACSAGNKPSNKEAVLDMQSLRHSFSGYNEEGVEFPSSKDSGAAVRKRSFSKKGSQDPISCYLIEPKKVTCMHKDIIYKIQLPSSDVADDEIGRIVESIYRAVEVNRSSIGRGTIEDSSKRKRASDEYLKSLFLNNLIFSAHPKTALMPAYNGNNAIYLPLIIPVSQSKLEAAKPPLSYYPGLLIDPKLQLPYNLSVNGGVDASSGVSAIGKNVLIDNGFGGQYVLPESYFMQASNLRQRSDNNITTDEEKRRNWLALMATNGYVPVDRGINVKLANSAHSHIADSDQSLSDDKEALGSNRKLKIEETGEFLDKLLNKRQERDTYHLRRQLRKRPCNLANNNRPDYFDRVGEEKHQLISKITDNVGEIDVEGRGKGQQCPCPRPTCTTKCTTTCSPKCTTKCPPKCPTPCPTPCPLPCPTRCPCPKPGPPPCSVPCLPQYPTSCPTTCSTTCPTTCTTPCPTTCSTPCPTSCSTPYPTTCSTICPQHGPLSYPDFESGVISNTASKTSRQRQPIKSSSNVVMAQYENHLYPYNINAQSVIANQQQSPHLFLQSEGSNVGHQVNIISGKAVSHSSKELVLVANSSVAMDLKAKKPKDSFFSRLRSKFHKGILTNGTGTLNSSSNNQVQNKFRPPIVRFDQGPTGQVWHVSHELSVSANQMRHQPNTSSATPQQTIPAQSNQTRSVIHYNQPNQPNQPVIPLTPLQPTSPQPQITVNQTPPSGYQPPGSQSMPSGQPQQPTLPSGYQPQSPGNQTQPSMNQTQPGNQAPPPVGQSLPSGSQPLPSGSGPQSPGNNQCQPPNGGMTQPTTTTQATTNVQPTTTQCQTKQTTCTIRYQTTLPTSQPPNLANSGKTSNHQNHTNMGPPAPGRKVCQPLESQLHVPFQTLHFPKSQQQAKPLQARTNQFTGQIQQRPQAGRFPEPEWQQPPNEEIPLWKPPKPYQAPILTQGQSFYQPYANPQMYPNQVVHTTHLRIQPNIPSPSLAEQPITINQNVVHRIENPYQNVSRLPRTSFKWGKRHKALGINSEIPKIQGIEGARKVKWPMSPTSIYEKIARVRRYLKSRVKRRGLP